MINVTKSYLPPQGEYNEYLKGIWQRVHLTNHGPLVTELEERLKEYLGVKHLFFLNNGTIAIQIAIKALDLKDEIITTPFSYVATTSSIVWENCTPVFADIHPKTYCIDPAEVEKKITAKTTAILATHVYGNPCDVEALEQIAKQYNLKVIYDAAHAFGVKYKNTSVLNFGDISTLSFHATKIFHTIEGGAIVTNNDELAHRIAYMRNFGHNGSEDFWGVGINGKASEFNAAMGLCILPDMEKIIAKRRLLSERYDKILENLGLSTPLIDSKVIYNYSYYPIIFESEEDLLEVKKILNASNIYPRRYFYPSLNTLNYVNNTPMPISEDISKRVLCLPLYYDLQEVEAKMIGNLVVKVLKDLL
jgi:dTDP-4-amino-4,6-dideoxygalactose transaminase